MDSCVRSTRDYHPSAQIPWTCLCFVARFHGKPLPRGKSYKCRSSYFARNKVIGIYWYGWANPDKSVYSMNISGKTKMFQTNPAISRRFAGCSCRFARRASTPLVWLLAPPVTDGQGKFPRNAEASNCEWPLKEKALLLLTLVDRWCKLHWCDYASARKLRCALECTQILTRRSSFSFKCPGSGQSITGRIAQIKAEVNLCAWWCSETTLWLFLIPSWSIT